MAEQSPFSAGEKTVEVSGQIKWFDVVKGYGFIEAGRTNGDGGFEGDILLHHSCLRRAGYEVPREGTTVVCEAVRRSKGLQALKVLRLDDSTAIAGENAIPLGSDIPLGPVIADVSGMAPAAVKWFNRARGYGFVSQGPGTPDLFIHMETIRRCGLVELRAGQQVRVRISDGPKGQMVADIACVADDSAPKNK